MKKTFTEFEKFFYRYIFPKLEPVEVLRRKVVTRGTFVFILFSLLLLASYLLVYHTEMLETNKPNKVFLLSGFGVLVVGFIVGSYVVDFKSFRSSFKSIVVEPIITFINPDLNYNPEGFVNQDTFNFSRIFLHYPNRYKGEDLVLGKIGNANVKMSEVEALYVVKSGGKKKYESIYNIFSGLLFAADFGVEFHKSTIIIPRSDIPDVFTKKAHRERSEVLMEIDCPDFSSHFAVYSEDANETQRLLTKPFLQRIIDLNRKHSGKVYLSFVGSYLFIAISKTDNLLEPPLFKNLTRIESVKPYFEQVQQLTSLLFDLNPSQ
ncbi:DUF3137 domain-containing protein [Perlabentimonas gracilis]|uniref:DUF3137 domain-containing protein n=1 Tax=Perlabentimonas gracilis TaxID=2715279 RepID=UPI00140DD288|nr:DUF3137 domain-containing protein [Perlabentimonas gracilis]NHB67187.1 DUF3137 domain-containing protein [Perlabentimonas gracilis]